MNMTEEKLAKAERNAHLLLSDLRDAHGSSEPLVEMILRPLIEQAAKIEQALKALNSAMKPGESGRR